MRKIFLVAALIVPASFARAESDAGHHSTLAASSPQAKAEASAHSAARAERVATTSDAATGQNGAR